MFRRIRSRLTVAFSIPLALLLVVTVSSAWTSLRTDQSVARDANLAIAANGPSGIVTALQNERDEAGADMVGVAGEAHLPVSSDADARHKTDQALAAFEASVRASGGPTQRVFQPAIDSLSRLAAVRSQVDSFHGTKSLSDAAAKTADVAAFDQYANLIDGFLAAVSTAPQHMSDPTLRSSVETLDLLLNQSESLTVLAQQMFATGLLESGPHTTSTVPAADFGAYQLWTGRLSAYTSGPDGAIVSTVVRTANAAGQAMLPFVKAATAGAQLDVLGFTNAIRPATTGASGLNAWEEAAGAIGRHISQRAAHLRHQATIRVIAYSGVAVVSVLLGLLILLRVSRSISRPLAQLASDARRMADEELPAAVQAIFDPGTAGPESAHPEATPAQKGGNLQEVMDVAGALASVKSKALDLATEQAVLRRKVADAFVNLGRRNQNLVTRQLDLITQIEGKEDDPATLEDLFRLDHLATRLRRHAESLLVIAGSGALRPWSEAASAVDVVRAASAEVEDYQRLQLHHFDHAVVSASVTTDLVHILAELMENALAFSPPHSSVGLHGRALESGYTISVVDAGIGMGAEALEEANRRLVSGGDLDDAASRHLGLVVAGRLASRHGITVALRDSEPGGVAARIHLPAGLIESSVVVPSGSGVASLQLEPPAQDPHPVEPVRAEPPESLPVVSSAAAALAVAPPAGPGLDAPPLGAQALAAPPVAEDPTTVTYLAPGDDRAGAHYGDGAQLPRRVPPPGTLPTSGALTSGDGSPGAHLAGGTPLPRRVPGASLPGADDVLRRDRTPAAQTPWALSNALSDYLNNHAEPPTDRSSTEGR